MAETKSYQKNQFNTTEGGIYFGHICENNSKMAVALRAIFPSNFLNAQYIALQQTGKMRGSILNSAPAVYSIFCGEKPVNGQAGVWLAENGDIDIRAPRGKITLEANNIEIISKGDSLKTGHILASAAGKIHGIADDVQWASGDNLTLGAEGTISIITPGQVTTVAGNEVSREAKGLNVGTPGGGSETFLEWLDGVKRLINSI